MKLLGNGTKARLRQLPAASEKDLAHILATGTWVSATFAGGYLGCQLPPSEAPSSVRIVG